ncbi:uncharacterized protein [Prorops nasuta]|uniref:uncharacterized protein n=1 Tax=Prorops nasuta TaxID=863751 RepID=UPI0034CEF968
MSNCKRNENFSYDEKIAFIQIIKKYASVIESKKTDGVGLREKSNAWYEVSKEFNNLYSSSKKTVDILKRLWNNLKASARKHFAKLKRETYLTGGGTHDVKPNDIYDKVHEIIGLSIEGLSNAYDKDAIISQNNIRSLIEDDENNNSNSVELDDPVFEYLVDNDHIKSWSTWDPKQLKSPLSTPLNNSIERNLSLHTSKNINVSSIGKKTKVDTKKTLEQSKIELTELMQKYFCEKGELEKQLLEIQCRKEKLQVELLELEIKHKSMLVRMVFVVI